MGPDEAEVMVKIKEQVVEPQEISSADELAHQRRAPKDALQLAYLVLIQHRGSRVLKTFRRGGSLRLILSIR